MLFFARISAYFVLAALGVFSANTSWALTQNQALLAMETAQVGCGSVMGCPAQVAWLLHSWRVPGNPRSFEVERCTGFLVAPNVLATNKHCIPEDLIRSRDLRGRMVAKFPATNGAPAEHASAVRLISVSPAPTRPGDLLAPDYAFVLLDAHLSERGFMPLATALPQSGDRGIIHAVYMTSTEDALQQGAGVAEVRSGDVSVTEGSPYLENLTLAQWPAIFSFRGAMIQYGISGSPIVDYRTGHVIGIDYLGSLTSQLGVANTVACMRVPHEAGETAATQRARAQACPTRAWHDFRQRP